MLPRTLSPQRVKAIRLALGMNISQFARECNTSRQVIYSWEDGTNAPSGVAARLLELFEEQHEQRGDHREESG